MLKERSATTGHITAEGVFYPGYLIASWLTFAL
jgi:hypothetical protein